ncbi:MAG: SsrA-binding protein SmpB [Alphaproteobacteria bacterium]|jgi:SsrA-binding protein|nr:SsrA-binding protein SmpB [Alphaproteobacteria bacterium]MCV6599766.1 SsrA-binding protein SmpB [Alphaproteobacteria bacterium]
MLYKDFAMKKQTISKNKKAYFDFFITDTIEAGIVLTGSEVKSLRLGGASIAESYADIIESGELFLVNSYIKEYEQSGKHLQHEPKRIRKLLLHKKELRKFSGEISKKGITIVPLHMYFNENGKVKIELGIAKGKKKHDKRESIKERDWNRDKARIMKNKI